MKILTIILWGAICILFPQHAYAYEPVTDGSDANLIGHVVDLKSATTLKK